MEIIEQMTEFDIAKETAVAIGKFDGFIEDIRSFGRAAQTERKRACDGGFYICAVAGGVFLVLRRLEN